MPCLLWCVSLIGGREEKTREEKLKGEREGKKRSEGSVQTSVVMPPTMTCFLPVAMTAARKSALSQASTSPWRWMKVALGCMAMISLGRAPFGPVERELDQRGFFAGVMLDGKKKKSLPESADVVRIVGRLKRFPSAEWARMLFRNSTGV